MSAVHFNSMSAAVCAHIFDVRRGVAGGWTWIDIEEMLVNINTARHANNMNCTRVCTYVDRVCI